MRAPLQPSSETSLSVRSLLEFGGCRRKVLKEPLVIPLECAVLKKVSYPASQRPHPLAYQFQRTPTVQKLIHVLSPRVRRLLWAKRR